jgi:hypothetical protein
MRYYCNPLNVEYKYQFVKHKYRILVGGTGGGADKLSVYREAADPSLVMFKDLYYLFPSMTAGFLTSEDMLAWSFHAFDGNIPILDYAPDVRVVGEYLYFCASKMKENCSFFRSKNPLTEPFEEIKGTFPFWDPNLFYDDDKRLYFYWGCSNITPIYGVELDPITMKPLSGPLSLFTTDRNLRGYERNGDDHCSKTKEQVQEQVEAMIRQLMGIPEERRRPHGLITEEDVIRTANVIMGDRPFIEGAWMTKHKGRYYLQYAVPGTEYNIYCDGVYVSDSPLGPFVLARNNPFSYKPGGFINGAGHGSTMKDRAGNFWHTATMRISCNDNMERRLGLWKAGFDEDGALYCDQRYGDWPAAMDTPAFTKPDWMLLSYGKRVKASSGAGTENVTDENIRTWWKASSAQSGEWVEVDLGKAYDVKAVQINFADDNVQAEMPEGAGVSVAYDERYIDRNSGYTRWLLEGSVDGQQYFTVYDKRDAQSDLSHDFLIIEESRQTRYLRLTVIQLPYNQIPCVSGIRVFGADNGTAPKKPAQVVVEKTGEMDIEVSWEKTDATGFNILWGYAPEKLYHSYMVFGKHKQHIGALIKDEPLFVRVDAFNESGITEGDVQEVIL